MEIKLPPALTAEYKPAAGHVDEKHEWVAGPGVVVIMFGFAEVARIQLTEEEDRRFSYYGQDTETELCNFVAGWLKARWKL